MTPTSFFARICALVLLVVLSPLLIALWLICLVAHGRPVMFRQFRAGKDTKPFRLLKFRTMCNSRDEDGNLLPDEQRVTAVGTFLRRTRIDELPGLVNVVRGDMAFVGPRPLLPETIEELGERGRKRCAVKPGLTGWSQVNGNTLLTLDQKVALDLWYIDHRGALLDLRILALTLFVVVAGERIRSGTA
ncbi:sugar transferase [Aurantiacibacter hainanensis]|uniref:sugar transferase n=1 Tax=Aurantiacibacter hainanensis TaxID=3076114 RepID=UPI0030C68B66